jgi:lipopolysaccharide heptosyltransferase II
MARHSPSLVFPILGNITMKNSSITADSIQRNILVFMPNFIGDCVMATPALSLIKQLYPTKKIYLVCLPHISPMFERDTSISVLNDPRVQYGKFKGGMKLINSLNKLNIELVFLLRNSAFEAIIAKLSGIKIAIGYNVDGSKFLLNYWLKINRNRHYINRYAHMVNLSHGKPFTYLPETSLISKKSKIISEQEKLNIGCYFGGKVKSFRFYPTELSRQVLKSLSDIYTDASFYLLGDSKEKDCNEALRAANPEIKYKVVNTSGALSITELVDTISCFDILISIDSGPLHIAAALNIPYVAIVGLGTSPWSTVEPKNKNGHVLLGKGIKIEDESLIEEITPSQIGVAVKKFLN